MIPELFVQKAIDYEDKKIIIVLLLGVTCEYFFSTLFLFICESMQIEFVYFLFCVC